MLVALSACGGSHSSIPGGPVSSLSGPDAKSRTAAVGVQGAAINGDVVAIDAGGGASGSFSADADYTGSSFTYASTSAVGTSGVSVPAPQAVYQTQRTGYAFGYTIPGLTPGANYTVRLSFAELYFTSAGQRVFNVAIQGYPVLTNFDVYTVGGPKNVVIGAFTVTANSTGTINIALTSVKNYAIINAIEVAPMSAAVSINSGSGLSSGGFLADQDYGPAANSFTTSTLNAIDLSGVTNPAAGTVYQTQRTGYAFTYTVPGLTAGATYTVRLDFAELAFSVAGKRAFDVAINNTAVLSGFDIVAAAGAPYKAVGETFTTTASSTGTIAIAFTSVTNYATVNGIEITAGGTSTATPAPNAFVDWPTYAYDAQRSGFNPYTTGLTPTSVGNIHLAWQTKSSGGRTQPIVITNIAGHQAVLVVGSNYSEQAYDALTGALVWQTALPKQDVQACGTGGIGGTAVYDKALNSIFVEAGNGNGTPNHTLLFRLDAATGAITGSVDMTPTLEPSEANFGHTGVELVNGLLYAGTGSDCEGSGPNYNWRGRLVAVDPNSMSLDNTFFTTWGQGGNYGGGGVWSYGAVSADVAGNIYSAIGNSETLTALHGMSPPAPFVATNDEQAGYAEHLVKLTGNLSTLLESNYPGFNFTIGITDLDYAGTPVVVTPSGSSGCSTLTATQGKGGTLVINNASTLDQVASYALSVPSGSAYYIGNPAYSPATGYIYGPISSAGNGSSLLPPGLAAIGNCGTSMVWHAQFGPDSAQYSGDNPRSAPTVTAGGVVFIATPCTPNGSGGCGSPSGTAGGAVWAVDASSGAVLGGGKPVLITGNDVWMAPSADGLWVYVYDTGGNFYALTVDPSVKAISTKTPVHATSTLHLRESQ